MANYAIAPNQRLTNVAIDLTAHFAKRWGHETGDAIDPDSVADDFEPITVVLPSEMARVVEAAIKLRRSKGDLPGEDLDREAYMTIIQNHDRGRALYDICAAYILKEA